MTRIVGAAAAALMLTAAGSVPVGAASDFDGVWKVKTSAETGKCSTNYDLSVRVKDGKLSYAGMWPVKATGGINDLGLVRMNIAHAGTKVAATGLVRGDSASGDWASKTDGCTGSWVARRA